MNETKVAVMAIIVESPASVETLNALLHRYSAHIIGRMGLPYKARGISLVSVAMDAPQEVIAALAEELRALAGVSVACTE